MLQHGVLRCIVLHSVATRRAICVVAANVMLTVDHPSGGVIGSKCTGVCAAAMAHPLCRAHRLRPGSPRVTVRRTSGLLTEDLYLRLVAIAQSAAGALLSNRYPLYRPHTCSRYASARACCANSHMLVRLNQLWCEERMGLSSAAVCNTMQHDATRCNML